MRIYANADSNMPDLIGLPLDVKIVMFSYIRKRKDLKNLYRTCKDSYETVIPRIYHSIWVREHIHIPTLCAGLNPDNRGLPHIRHVHIISGRSELPKDRSQYDNVLHMLANQLPRDRLHSFTYVSLVRFKITTDTM